MRSYPLAVMVTGSVAVTNASDFARVNFHVVWPQTALLLYNKLFYTISTE